MRLIAHGFSTEEGDVVTSTANIGIMEGAAASAGKANVTVRKIVVFCGGTTVAANSSGGIKFVYGASSAALNSTLVFPTPYAGTPSTAGDCLNAAPATFEIDDLNIVTRCFKLQTNEASHGGWSGFVLGN